MTFSPGFGSGPFSRVRPDQSTCPGRADSHCCSQRAAAEYGLHVVAPAIQDDPHNRTRFAVICLPQVLQAPEASGKDCVSLVVSANGQVVAGPEITIEGLPEVEDLPLDLIQDARRAAIGLHNSGIDAYGVVLGPLFILAGAGRLWASRKGV